MWLDPGWMSKRAHIDWINTLKGGRLWYSVGANSMMISMGRDRRHFWALCMGVGRFADVQQGAELGCILATADTYLLALDSELPVRRVLRLVDALAWLFASTAEETLEDFKGDITPWALLDPAMRRGCVVDLLWTLPSSMLRERGVVWVNVQCAGCMWLVMGRGILNMITYTFIGYYIQNLNSQTVSEVTFTPSKPGGLVHSKWN